MTNRSSSALKAWETRRSPTYRARRTANASKIALKTWAAAHGWYLVALDGPSGNPRTGIVDALLVRVATYDADELEVRLLQLKGGSAGLKALERRRLATACAKMSALPAYAFFDGEEIEVDLPPRKSQHPATASGVSVRGRRR